MARTPAPGTRERILDVASRLFYARGVRAVGMNEIIDVAGTGKNLLYRHFPAKDDLVAAYLTEVGERRERAVVAALHAAGDDPGDRLVALVTEVGEQVRRPWFRGCAFRNYLVEFPDGVAGGVVPSPGLVAREMLRDSRARIGALATQLVGAGAAADALAGRVWLVVDGLYLQAAYRARLDGAPADTADPLDSLDSAIALTRRLVDDAVARPA